MSLAAKDSHFIFDGKLYKQIDGVAMGPPLGPTLTNAFWSTTRKIGSNIVHWNIDHYTIEGTFMIYLFYLIQQNISIDQFCLLFSSLNMRLLVFHLAYHCIFYD